MSDRVRWGVGCLALALMLAVLDSISTSGPKAGLVIVCLLVIGSVLILSEALSRRHTDNKDRPAPR